MPEVGNRSTFAIEWHETRRDDWSVYGYFCLWAGDQRIGIDYEDESPLSRTAEELRKFLSYSDERHLAFLDGTSKEEIYGYVYELGHGAPVPMRSSSQRSSAMNGNILLVSGIYGHSSAV